MFTDGGVDSTVAAIDFGYLTLKPEQGNIAFTAIPLPERTGRRSSANAPQRETAAQRKVAVSTVV